MNKLRLTFMLSLAATAGTGYLLSNALSNLTTGFIAKGWAENLGLKRSIDSTSFLMKCSFSSPCISNYANVFTRRNGYWYLGALALALTTTLISFKMVRAQEAIDPNYKGPGNSRWAHKDELELYIKGSGAADNPQRGYLGMLRDGTMLSPPEFLRNAHAVVIGGPGAAKSTGYHKPNMILDALQGSVSVIFDLKFPDPGAGFFDMVPLFYEAGRNIQMYAPFSFTTMRLNLLQNATVLEGAYDLAQMIIPKKEDEGGASFYKDIERTLLSAILLGIANTEMPSMERAFKICLRGATSIREFITSHPDITVRDTAAAMLETDNKTLGGIAASLTNALQIFNHPALSRATTPKDGENIDLDNFWWEPGIWYNGLEQSELRGTRGKIFIQLLKRFLDNSMLRCSKMEKGPSGQVKKAGKMPLHTVVYLDEFANMGALPDISENFATMRSYRVSYHLTLQNLAQGEVLYGKDGFRSFFTNNLQHILFFPSRTKGEDAKYFSEYLGDITVKEERWNQSEREQMIKLGSLSTKGRSWGDAAREMLSPGEMLSYPPNEAILFLIGAPAVQVVMPGYYQSTYYLYKKDPKTGRSIEDRSRKYKNPINEIYKALNLHDPADFMRDFLGNMDQQLATAQQTETTAEENMQIWAEAICNHGAKALYYQDKDKAVIYTDGLPQSLICPEDRSIWEEKDWIVVKPNSENPNQIEIKKDGIRVLGYSLVQKIAKLRFTGQFLMWFQANAVLLENHPARTQAHGKLPEAMGYYEAACVYISNTEVKKIWGVTPPKEHLLRRNGQELYRIPLDDDEFMENMERLRKAASGEQKDPNTDPEPQKKSGDKGKTASLKPQQNKPETKPQTAKEEKSESKGKDSSIPTSIEKMLQSGIPQPTGKPKNTKAPLETLDEDNDEGMLDLLRDPSPTPQKEVKQAQTATTATKTPTASPQIQKEETQVKEMKAVGSQEAEPKTKQKVATQKAKNFLNPSPPAKKK